MIYNFRTAEGQWVVNPEDLTWARTSSIISSPSVVAAASNLANFVPIETGKLVPLGGGRYSLDGRKPLNEKQEPQLSIFIILTILTAEDGGTCVSFLQANVETTDFQQQEIKKFKCESLPAIPTPTRPAGMATV